MSKAKYCYVIADKENGSLLVNGGNLPIYWRKNVAKEVCKHYKGYVVNKIDLDNIETLVLFSKPA